MGSLSRESSRRDGGRRLEGSGSFFEVEESAKERWELLFSLMGTEGGGREEGDAFSGGNIRGWGLMGMGSSHEVGFGGTEVIGVGVARGSECERGVGGGERGLEGIEV